MLIEQIFDLRGPGPPGRRCTPIISCFHNKTIISKNKFLSGLLFTAKILQEAMYFTSPTRAKSLAKFNPRMQDFKSILDLNCKQKEDGTT